MRVKRNPSNGSTEETFKAIRRATRRRHAAEEKIRIVLQQGHDVTRRDLDHVQDSRLTCHCGPDFGEPVTLKGNPETGPRRKRFPTDVAEILPGLQFLQNVRARLTISPDCFVSSVVGTVTPAYRR